MWREKLIPAFLFLVTFTAGLLTFPPWKTLTYDEALYIDIARSIAEGRGFTYQGVYMMYRPPLYPYTLSLILYFLPYGHHLAVARLVSLLFHSLTAVLVYFLASALLGDKWKAVTASLFYIFNPLAFTMATRALVHAEFTFFYTLSLYMLFTAGDWRRTVLAFFFAALAVLTRYTGLTIVGVIFTYLYLTEHWTWVRRREIWLGLAVFLLTLFPWLYLGHLHYGGFLRPFEVASRVVTMDKPISASDFLRMLIKDIGFVLPLLSAVGFVTLKKDRIGWFLISWLTVGLFGILTVIHKETRFVTFLSPAFAVLTSLGVAFLIDVARRFVGIPRKFLVFLLLSGILLVPVVYSALSLKDEWDSAWLPENEVLSCAVAYKAEKILVSPRLYTLAGYYFPDADVKMLLSPDDVQGAEYDLIIAKGIPVPEGYSRAPCPGPYMVFLKRSMSTSRP
ncbi:ArnT family glycosyltransferase [Pyrococcus yayanosii]|uniref:Glycosyltransferase RgtA/B/C/D-like domain-containing protein n=1 Tax=Pyrococcus yayanosii (strain CH1 / JCM 16557) TaxID=529709 RepID=F8AGF3_PYRYC|nr:glycosyltransferase family 39 protein [Pyrococcus yayanosii]AEH25149.1 hypothetical protein PYCH_14810 [Pyrococcus yayanosii CH1]